MRDEDIDVITALFQRYVIKDLLDVLVIGHRATGFTADTDSVIESGAFAQLADVCTETVVVRVWWKLEDMLLVPMIDDPRAALALVCGIPPFGTRVDAGLDIELI